MKRKPIASESVPILEYELVIVGAGTAGFAAASVAARQHRKTLVIERGPFGGLCILKGCMPSKMLLRTAQIAREIRDGGPFGVIAEEVTIRPDIYIERKKRLVQSFADYRIANLAKLDVDVLEGEATFLDDHTIQVGSQIIRTHKCIVATGSREFIPPIPGISDVDYLISDDVLDLCSIPRSVAILGGGAIALEMASYFDGIGTDVVLIQRSGHILSKHDEDVALSLQTAMQEVGIQIYAGTRIERVGKVEGGIRIEFVQSEAGKSGEVTIDAEALVLALGRIPYFDSLNLEAAGVRFDRGRLVLNDYFQTTNPDILVAGDAANVMLVGNVVLVQGEIAVHNAFHEEQRTMEYWRFPQAIFSTPEFASVGRSQRELDSANVAYETATYPFDDEGKAISIGKTHGMLKIIYEKPTRKILGVAIVGEYASELIHEAAVLLHFDATTDDLAQIPHVHPTLGEIYTYLTDELI